MSEYVCEQMADGISQEKWDVISLVRDPVSRNVGTFFQHIDVCGSSVDSWTVRSFEYDFELTFSKTDPSALADLFFQHCRHDNALVFFDREFESLFGLDVYGDPFPTKSGYDTYSSQQLNLLLLRLEDLDRCGPGALGDFLTIPPVELVHRNEADHVPFLL